MERKIVVGILAGASFLVLFQAYLVAPLIPALSDDFHASAATVGLMIPAYTIPYGLSALFYGPLSDRYGRKPVLLALLSCLSSSMILIAYSRSVEVFLSIRIITGLGTGGLVPISVALIGDLFPEHQRGKPIGLLYGAMAGGMTFGSTLGAYLNPIIGWRMEFIITGIVSIIVVVLAALNHKLFISKSAPQPSSIVRLIRYNLELLTGKAGAALYSYIFLNGMFHSGVFAWLGYYFSTRYHLDDKGIGLALLGYGLPGMLLGVRIGKAADSFGRNRIIPAGLAMGTFAVALLIFQLPLAIACVTVALLSLGYDMTQPLFAGLITSVGTPATRGQAVGLSACVLFTGYGLGSLAFQALLKYGIGTSLGTFVLLEGLLFIVSLKALRPKKTFFTLQHSK